MCALTLSVCMCEYDQTVNHCACRCRVVLWTLLSTINSDIVSLEDMLEEGLVSQNTRRPRSGRSKRIRQRALQGALYHSAEHGFLDIAMQLRQQGSAVLHILGFRNKFKSLKSLIGNEKHKSYNLISYMFIFILTDI